MIKYRVVIVNFWLAALLLCNCCLAVAAENDGGEFTIAGFELGAPLDSVTERLGSANSKTVLEATILYNWQDLLFVDYDPAADRIIAIESRASNLYTGGVITCGSAVTELRRRYGEALKRERRSGFIIFNVTDGGKTRRLSFWTDGQTVRRIRLTKINGSSQSKAE